MSRIYLKFSKPLPFLLPLLILLASSMLEGLSFAASKTYQRAAIAEPFLEIRTGAGRSYPVFYIAEKGEEVFLLKRRIDWFKVRLFSGEEGWVPRAEIEKTLRNSGYQKNWRERFFDQHIANKVELGWGWGLFDEDNMFHVRAAYLFTPTFSIESNLGFASSPLGETNLYLLGLVMRPWTGKYFALYGALGAGVITTRPSPLLINVKGENFETAYVGVGFSAPLFRKLSLRGDFKNYTLLISPEKAREVQEMSLGVSFAF